MERSVSQTATEQFVREHIRRILSEEKPKKKSRRARGEFIIKSSVPGAPPKGMRLADPKKIMDNLKAKGGASSIDQLEGFLSKVIGATDQMSDAYGSVKGVKDTHGREGVEISMGSLDNNNGARFMKITLSAAQSTGALQMDEDMRVEVGGAGVIVYKTKGGSSSWNKDTKKKK
jgi:hypothetical protein